MTEIPNSDLEQLLANVAGPLKEKREEALNKLQILNRTQLWGRLEKFIESDDSDLVCRTLETMMYIDADLGHAILITQLSTEDVVVRWHICNLLTHYGRLESIEPLSNILKNDPEPDIRIYAALALGSIGAKESIPDLLWVIENDEGKDHEGRTVRSAAQRALMKINTI